MEQTGSEASIFDTSVGSKSSRPLAAVSESTAGAYVVPFGTGSHHDIVETAHTDLVETKESFASLLKATEAQIDDFHAAIMNLMEKKSESLWDRQDKGTRRRRALQHLVDQRFASEDRKPIFSQKTFIEEMISQTGFSFLGPVTIPLIVYLCGVYGSRITGFIPGKIPEPNNKTLLHHKILMQKHAKGQEIESAVRQSGLHHIEAKEEEECNATNNDTFVFQLIFFVIVGVPQIWWIWRFATGDIVLYADVAGNKTGVPRDKDVTYVLPFGEMWFPAATYALRQIVIAIKYGYRPRRTMRQDRKRGIKIVKWEDDMLGTVVLEEPRVEAVCEIVDRAAWRAGVLTDLVNLQFAEPISDDDYYRFDFAEKSPPKEIKKSKDPAKLAEFERSHRLPRTHEKHIMPLRVGLKYVVGQACKLTMPGSINLMALTACFIPCIYRLVSGQPAMGDSHFDKIVCASSVFKGGMGAMAVLMFPYAAQIVFDRQRMALDRWFSLLIPKSIPDARDVNHGIHGSDKIIAALPDLLVSSRNIFAWNLGRRVVRRILMVYHMRLCLFLGLYGVLLCMVIGYQIVTILVSVSRGEAVRFDGGFYVTMFYALALTYVFFKIIFAGLYTNRQMKYHTAAITQWRTRLEAAAQAENEKIKLIHGESSAEAKQRSTSQKEIQRALKLVANEIESESETEKIRILNVPVDSRMLEGLVGLLGALFVTLWQAFTS